MQKKEFRMFLVNRIKDATPKDRARIVQEILQTRYEIPFSKKTSIGKTTLYRYLCELRKTTDWGMVLVGKARIDRGSFPSLSETQKSALLKWRMENPCRTREDLRDELMSHDELCEGSVPSASSIGRFLKSYGLTRAAMRHGSPVRVKIRMAFEAEYSQQIWMADTKGPNIYVIDPDAPENDVLAMPIVLLDDHSRFIVAVLYVIVENEAVIMALFHRAVLLYGVPEILYIDRGSPYMGRSLKRAASLIGCNLIYTMPSDPAAKGKVERVMETIHTRFEYEMLASGKKRFTLEEYNQHLAAYVSQDYHREVHSSTHQPPEERFMAHPAHLRRWVSKDSLAMIFLPCTSAKVTKTGLVRIKLRKYLVPDAALVGKKVVIRYKHNDSSRVYLWYEDKYYGEAFLFEEENDLLNREKLRERVKPIPEIVIPDMDQVPAYGRLERQFAQYREEMASFDLNTQLSNVRDKKGVVRAALLTKESKNEPKAENKPEGKPKDKAENKPGAETFDVDAFIYLLAKLLRRKFAPSERLQAHSLWKAIGPLDEAWVRVTVGRLLGEEKQTDNISGYLEEIRLDLLMKQMD
jgi:transposase InsO family protein